MAPKLVTSPTKMSFLLLFLVLLAPFICSEPSFPKLKETKMTLHTHHRDGGLNATAAIVTGIPGKAWSYTGFGTVFANDDPMTEGPDMNSPVIARAQGIYVSSSLDGLNMHVMFSIVFSNEDYYGSTLEIQGRSALPASVREFSVVGGTGKFRFAKGFATFETIKLDLPNLYALVRCNVTVLHY